MIDGLLAIGSWLLAPPKRPQPIAVSRQPAVVDAVAGVSLNLFDRRYIAVLDPLDGSHQ
jgi:hypothetical protein